MEFGNELWFGSSDGVVLIYNQEKETFVKLTTELTSDIISIQEISSDKILIVSNNDGFVINSIHNRRMDIYDNKTETGMLFSKI